MNEEKLIFNNIVGNLIEDYQHEGPEALGTEYSLEFGGKLEELDKLADFIKEKTNIKIKKEKKTTDLLK